MIEFGDNLRGTPTGNRKKASELFHTDATHDYLEVRTEDGELYWVTEIEANRAYDYWEASYFEP